MAALKSCAWSFSRCCALVAALVVLPVSLLAQSISGTVVNNSTWLNDESQVPPQWHVAGTFGTVVPGEGRVMVALFLSSDLENRIDSLPLEPADMISLVDLGTIIGSNWAYELGDLLAADNYRVIAWIDGNDNGVYDVGEPHGHSNVRISGDSSINNIKLTIREDSDLDGMEDWWEAHWFGDLSQTADMDYDNDGLSNIDEYNLVYGLYPDYIGINVFVRPDRWDTDGDGMDDAWEVFYRLDPTSVAGVNGASGDPDVDGISNIAEYVGPDGVGWRRDANGDGIAEFTISTDAMNPTDDDSDRDGVTDDDEFLVDLTHPVHPMSGNNFMPRSLGMNVDAGAGASITDPTGNTFALGYGGGTVECWVYPQTDGNGVLVSFPAAEAAGLDHFRISLDDFRPKLEILTGAAVQAKVGGAGVAGSVQQLEPGQWNHLAFVIAPENKSLSIHLNGVLLIAQTVLINLDYAGTPTICRDFTDGYLDELRIWNYPRPVSDIEYWSSRYYPAPGYVRLSADTRSGRTVQMYDYSDPHPLMLYLRFDDGGDAVENFAFLNHGLYPYSDTYRVSGPITAAVTTDQAVPMFGSDDADGDELPEWWVELHNMEKFQEYYTSAYGPVPVWCPENGGNLLGFEYYRSFVGYGSVGNQTGWNEAGSTVFHMPKTSPDFFEGDNASYTKHVYLFTQPRSCPLSVYTPGMTSTVVFVNGEQATTTGDEGNQGQQYDVAQYMRIGRNTVHIQCKSSTMVTSYNAASGGISGLPYAIQDYQAYSATMPDAPVGCDEKPYRFKVSQGKFDAELTCNGMPVIVRGDKTRADARAVWHVQLWSTYFEWANHVPLPDREYRDARSNPDYGVPLHAERDNNPLAPDSADDGLDAVYEFICGANPRERDSNNNGVTDGDEDYDSDGLVNREEQRFGSSPWLADSDDDGLHDGFDVGDGHPAQSLSPQRNQSLRFGGGAGDYISIPLQQRFALEKWSIEAWIQPDADEADGGILARRAVGGMAVNYEVGLDAANRPYARYISVAGVEVRVTGSAAVVADGSTWTHVAATYYDRELNLFINGTIVATQTGGSFPALYAGGPVQQRIGAGFKGCIDEWRLWKAELTGERIFAHRDEVLTGLEDDLVAYYRFDDGSSYDPGLPLVGTSANNGTNGALPDVAWEWGQAEDNALRYSSDWWLQWKHATTFAGSVAFSTNHIMQGPPRLQVFIENDDAVTAGARWSYNEGASWNKSDFVETHLSAGDYNISFKAIDGWISPATLPLTLVRGQSTVVTGTYVQTASLTVIVDNSAAIKKLATWSIDGGGTRRGSGTQVVNLVPGAPGYDVLFSDISEEVPGWDRPATFNVQLLPGESRTVSASYTPVKGALQIVFPPESSPSTARWRVSGNTNWWASGETVTNLAYGEHQVEYNTVEWWNAPAGETVAIERSAPAYSLSRNWEKLPEPALIPITVFNNSTWSNNQSIVPPHWHVAAGNGIVVAGRGQVKLALFPAADLTTPVDTQPIYPGVMGVLTDLGFMAGSNWVYSLGAPALDGDYRVVAWIDGNDNDRYDVGEPQGYAETTIAGGKSLRNVSISINDDTDSDGMADWWEVYWFGDLTPTGLMDYDNDGLYNIDEFALIYTAGVFVNPLNWDTDGDGMDDAWEVFYGLNPASASDSDADPDADELTNIEEYLGLDHIGWRESSGEGATGAFTPSTDATSPINADTDDDGVDDGDEVLSDLTHPVHPMSGTNLMSRSLSMNVNGGSGVAINDPTGSTFAFASGGGTVEFWVYPQTDGDGVLYAFPAAGAGQDHFRISLDDFRPKLEMLTGVTVKATVGGTNVLPTAGSIQQLPPDRWTHLAFVIEPVNKTVAVYVNGVLLIAQTTFIGPDLQGSPTICSGFADGYIDELRVWNYPRPLSDIEYWANRYYPAPGYVQTSSWTPYGETVQMYAYSAPHPLMLYLRFDDGGDTVENFAFLNSGIYPNIVDYRLAGAIAAAVTADQAVPMTGSDDADGDGLSEWWVDLYNLEEYPEYITTIDGPQPDFSADGTKLEGVEYFRSFVGYTSIGNQDGWGDGSNTVYYIPKTKPDFTFGDNSMYTKHVYLLSQPRSCPLNVYTPGMTSTVVYVNGVRITATDGADNGEQRHEVAPYMKTGRNTIHVECRSKTVSEEVLPSFQYPVAIGKFDAELTCNGMPVIVRGDMTRADPRAAWHVQVWSSYFAKLGGTSLPDRELRDARTNPDYGVPLHAERDNNPLDPDGADDGLDAVYEFICGTNPRYRDSNNNGVPDGDEDFDNDGLTNREEQRFGSSPWLADSDDDGINDGTDVGDGHPAQSLSPQRSQSLRFGGAAGDCITMPAQQRFALEKWSVETWVKPDADEVDGGILAQRTVGGATVNYEVGLNGSNRPYVRYVSVSGTETIVSGSAAVVADGTTWTHVAATYSDRKLNLFVNGTNVASTTGSSNPALYAGGPVQQRIGAGFKGCIDEWRLWNVALTRARILASIGEVVTGLEPDLVAYYRLDDGTSYAPGLPLVGTSANNGTNGSLPAAAWQWGQVEDNAARYASDWWQQWKYAASFAGNVAFSSEFIVQGAPRLQVFIEPDAAIAAGARWSYDGGATSNESDSVIYDLAAGDYVISFNSSDGWITPSNLPISLVRGQTTVVTGSYVKAASLTVIIDNSADIKAAAAWSIDGGGTLRGSGTKVINLVPGAPGYNVLFSDISSDVPGWDRPATFNVQLLPGESRTVSASYSAVQGSLQVSFTPTNAPTAARWRVSGNTNWWASGQIVSNLSYGVHDVEYNEVVWWSSPTNEAIRIERSSPVYTLSRDWIKLPEPSTITVTITPDGAIADGARWGVNGSWYDNGQTVVVEPGSHVVTYRAVTGWLAPADVTLDAVNAAAQATGAYCRVDIAGSVENGGFNAPWGVAATLRHVYVADSGNNRVQALDRMTGKWMTIGEPGTAAGRFRQPLGVVLAPNGDLWVADTGNHRIQRLARDTGVWTVFGSYGGRTGQFVAPYDVEVDTAGNVYVADYHNSRIQKRQPDGVWSVIIQGGTQEGRVRYPSGIALDTAGHLYVSDYDPSLNGFAGRIQTFNPDGTFIAQAGAAAPADGGLHQNMGMHVLEDGKLLVANTFANEIISRDASGVWEDVVREGSVLKPRDVTMDDWGNTILTDTGNNRILILPADDADRDGVPNHIEPLLGTDPLNDDSDDDGFSDGHESYAGTNPMDASSYPVLNGIGVAFEASIPDEFAAALNVKLYGLPPGLRYDAVTRLITGVPTQAGTYTVTVTATGVETATIMITVEALPVWAYGNFSGWVLTDDSGPGLATLAIQSNGRITGRLLFAGLTYTFAATSYLGQDGDGSYRFEAIATQRRESFPVAFTVHPPAAGVVPESVSMVEGELSAPVAGESVLYRNAWRDSGAAALLAPFIGYYTAAMPGDAGYGSGYLAFTVDPDGNVRTAGRLADGTVVSCSVPMVSDGLGRFWTVVYTAPRPYLGGVFFGLAEFADEGSGIILRPLDGEPFLWQTLSTTATGTFGDGFRRDVGLVGGWYDRLVNLQTAYADGLVVDVLTLPSLLAQVTYRDWNAAGRPETQRVQESISAQDDASPAGLILAVNAAGTSLAAPRSDAVPRDPVTKLYDYTADTNSDGQSNTAGLTFTFNRSTGLFSGSFRTWYDYISSHDAIRGTETWKHLSKVLKYQGILIPGREDTSDGIGGRGHYLWPERALNNINRYYNYNQSLDFLLLDD